MPKKKKAPIDLQETLFCDKDLDIPAETSRCYPVLAAEDYIKDIVCSRENGLLFQANCLDWLKCLKDESIDVVFADPPYNIGKTDWDRFESQEQYIQWSLTWIREAARVLKPSGVLFICGFSEILADLKHPAMRYFQSCKWLIWHYRNKANLGNDWGRSHESILLLRKSIQYTMNIDPIRIPYGQHTLKYPDHPQATTSQYGKGKPNQKLWKPNPLGAKPKDVIEIPTTCNGMGEKTDHPTQKPEELMRKLLFSSSNRGDIVLDPFSGSGTTVVVAEQLGRRWLGCEINADYNQMAIKRLNRVVRHSVDEWIAFDRENVMRRSAIR